VAVRYVCGRSIAEMAGSIPVERLGVSSVVLVCVVQVATFAASWSLVQRSPTVCVCVCMCVCVCVSVIVCDLETSTVRRPRPS
jgi:hypothetical protein